MLTANSMRRALLALVLFGTAFGYLEAAVVVYLRTIYEPIRQKISPRPRANSFRSSPPSNWRRRPRKHPPPAHGTRARSRYDPDAGSDRISRGAELQQWAAAFLIAFGMWDITFYLFLRLLIHWPASVLTWDLLFLIPCRG